MISFSSRNPVTAVSVGPSAGAQVWPLSHTPSGACTYMYIIPIPRFPTTHHSLLVPCSRILFARPHRTPCDISAFALTNRATVLMTLDSWYHQMAWPPLLRMFGVRLVTLTYVSQLYRNSVSTYAKLYVCFPSCLHTSRCLAKISTNTAT